MAEGEKHGLGSGGEELDPRSLVQNPAEAERPLNPRTTKGINLKDFYLPEGSESQRHDASPEGQKFPNSLYNQFQTPWRPAEAAEARMAEEARAAEAAESQTEEAEVYEQPEDADIEAIVPADFIPTGDEAEQYYPEDKPKAARGPITRFAAIGSLLGIVFGAVLVLLSWVLGKPPAPYDLGFSTSAASGLRGHLFTKWEDNKLQYRLAFQPSDTDLGTGFSFAVNNPPRPLSVDIQLKDAMGFVLCTREILLKYDAPGGAASPASPAAKPSAAPAAQATDATQIQAAEQQREQGKDVFQPQNGDSGRVEAINAQGVIPCSAGAYEKVAAWSFTSDFPSVAEQKDLLKEQAEKQSGAARAAAARNRAAQKPADKTLTFSIEGDNALVGYDSSTGAFETNSAMTFFVEKDSPNLSGWQNFPLRIHYRCDQTSFCTLTRIGSGQVIHAQLRR